MIKSIKTHQENFLNSVKSRTKPVIYTVEGVEIIVFPGVFPPATDTKLLASHIQTKKDDRVLDLTTGCGVFSVIAGLQGAGGIAVDINPNAVKNAEENFRKYGLVLKVVQGDLFEKVPEEKFDQIFVNGPYFEGEITDLLDQACYGLKKFTSKLFSKAHQYLKSNGRLLVTFGEWVDLKEIDKDVKENGLESKIIDKRKSDDGQRSYVLYEVWPYVLPR